MFSVEREMFSDLKIMYQTGKGTDHLVPVLVPTDVTPALCMLTTLENRKLVGMPDQNRYVSGSARSGPLQWILLNAQSSSTLWGG